jgi:hypothetical protein
MDVGAVEAPTIRRSHTCKRSRQSVSILPSLFFSRRKRKCRRSAHARRKRGRPGSLDLFGEIQSQAACAIPRSFQPNALLAKSAGGCVDQEQEIMKPSFASRELGAADGPAARPTRRRAYAQVPDRRQPARLLRACRERPGDCAAEQRDEVAPVPDFHRLDRTSFAWRTHSITSSASASSVGGISTSNAFAVARLMTRSNLVPRSTGRSPGFSPLRIRPT